MYSNGYKLCSSCCRFVLFRYERDFIISLVLTYTYLYNFMKGKNYRVNQRWRHATCLQHSCYDIGRYPCLWFSLQNGDYDTIIDFRVDSVIDVIPKVQRHVDLITIHAVR